MVSDEEFNTSFSSVELVETVDSSFIADTSQTTGSGSSSCPTSGDNGCENGQSENCLDKDSAAYDDLVGIVHNSTTQKDLDHIGLFKHTGQWL